MKNRGFTLVELSIVLVIIGLLVSGILVTQSMINTVKIQSFVRQQQQIDVAFTNFQTKYNSLPGDSVSFGGDGNGAVGTSASNYDLEMRRVFVDLQSSGFYTNDKTFTDTITIKFDVNSATPNSPKVPVGKDGGMVIFSNQNKQYNEVSNYQITPSYSLSSVIPTFLDGLDAQVMDTKMDDGVPNTGTVQGMGAFGFNNSTGLCQNAGKYVTDNVFGKKNCNLRFELFNAL